MNVSYLGNQEVPFEVLIGEAPIGKGELLIRNASAAAEHTTGYYAASYAYADLDIHTLKQAQLVQINFNPPTFGKYYNDVELKDIPGYVSNSAVLVVKE